MENKKILCFLILILFVVFISGCTNIKIPLVQTDSKIPYGSGVVIEFFGGDLPDNVYYSGEEVRFFLKVKNTGSLVANECFAELLGLDYTWKKVGETDITETGETFPDEEECKYRNRKLKLLPPDPEVGTEGEEAICSWRYIAPYVSTGLSINLKPRARFYYTYSSSTIKTILLVSKEELKALQQQGKSLPIESYSKTNSPIEIDIETATPVRTYGENKVEFPIVITVKNIGGGTPCYENSYNCKKPGGILENENWNKIDLKITLPPGLSPAPNSCKSSNNIITQQIVFVGTQPQKFSCKIIGEVPKQIGIIQKNIQVNATYGYFIDKTFELTVYPSTQPNLPKSNK
ncbi:MAG: hypothetical protein QW051_03230 [Candidatus Aenigmatarchaeota archaeon]